MAALMRNANTLRAALHRGDRPSFGAWQTLPGTHLTRTLAQAGFDWILLDCEHGNIADAEMHECVYAASTVGASPIVRVAANEDWMIKRALDAGAHGILVPLLNNADDAKKVVQSAKFPPMGKRGFGSPFSMGAFDIKGNLNGINYFLHANDHLLVCVQIETSEALADVEAIAQVDGIDVLFVGAWDLGISIGHPVRGDFDPELRQAITRVHEAAVAAGKWSGMYCPNGRVAHMYAEEGFHMISCITDMSALSVTVAEHLSQARGQHPRTSI